MDESIPDITVAKPSGDYDGKNGIDVAKALLQTGSDCKIPTNHHEMALDVLKSGVETFGFLEKSSDISKFSDGYRKYIMMLLFAYKAFHKHQAT